MSYAKSLVDCVQPYLREFFKNTSETNDLIIVLDTIQIIGNSLTLREYDTMSRIERLIDFAVEYGDNAAEFSMYIIQSYVEYEKNGNLDVILEADDSLLNVSDYLAQEYELATSHASEGEISNTLIMVAYMNFKFHACNLIGKHLECGQIASSSDWMNLSNRYVSVVKSLNVD